jgi:hypothetical protein
MLLEHFHLGQLFIIAEQIDTLPRETYLLGNRCLVFEKYMPACGASGEKAAILPQRV